MEVGIADDGKEFRCYLSPVSGYKFRSKKEVLHYLTAIKNDSHTSEMTSTGDNRQIVGSQVKSSQEWLPPGWILEIRVQKSGGKAGQKYKSYYDPSSGSRFYSEADVFRFLGSRKLHSPTPKQKKCSSHTMDNVLAQVEYSPDGLPPGWIKENKFRKSSTNGMGIKKDPYYTDPVHGYVFRSLKDAIHFVATGEVSKHAIGRGRKRTCEMCSLEGSSPPLSPVTELNALGVTVRRCLFTEEGGTSNAEMATGADDSSEKLQLQPAGIEKDVSINTSLDIESMKRKTKYKRTKVMKPASENMLETSRHVEKFKGKLLTLPTRASKRLAGCGPGPVAELVVCRPSRVEKGDSIELIQRKTEYRGKKIEPAAENLLENSTHVEKRKGKLFTLPSRASKRLAGCEPASVAEPVIHRSSCVGKADSIYSSPDTEHGKRKTDYNRGKVMDPAAENALGTSKHVHKRKHKLLTLPSRASKRLAGCEPDPPDPVAKLVIGCSSSKLMSHGGNEEQFDMSSRVNKEQVDDTVPKIEDRVPIVDPKSDLLSNDGYGGTEDQMLLAEHRSARSINEQTLPVEQIVAAKQTDDRSPSPLVFPFLDAWGDPCIEFAVKTLIGEIPVLDEIPAFVQNQMSAVPTWDPTASATVEFGHQSGAEHAKLPGQPEELQNQHTYVNGKAKPCPLEHGHRRVGQK